MPTVTENTSVPADPLAIALDQWKSSVVAELKGASFDKKLVTRTFEGVSLRPLYTRADLAGVPHLNALPGQAPYLRGDRPPGCPERPWESGQEITAGRAAEFNTAVLADLQCGQDSVVLVPDAATRLGLDPDEAAVGAVGIDGVSIADGQDLAAALAEVDLAAVPVHIRAGADPLPLAALYFELAQARGLIGERLSGSLTADPIGEWAARGELPASLDVLYDSMAGWTSWATNNALQLRTIEVNAALWGDAGGTAVQELAFALATGIDYLRALGQRGIRPVVAAQRLQFNFAIGPQFFMETAKFRAFRLLWSRVLKAFSAEAGAAACTTVHARTGRWNKTLLDPHVNMLRVTTEALSAVLGGCDSLHIAPFDEAAGVTDDFSRRIARNVHTLLAEEFHFAETIDPAGGSWYVEKLTDDLARKAWTLLQDIEKHGGFTAALRTGYPQQLIAAAAGEKTNAISTRRLGLVGTNLFPNLKETPLAPHAPDASAVQSVRARAIRGRRSAAPVPPLKRDWPATFATAINAAREGATIGQLARFARRQAPADAPITPVVPCRASAGFERLRRASAEFARSTGARPRVFLAKMGPVAQHKARADFTAGFFAVGGFEALAKQSFETPESAAQAAAASGASIAVLCSTDDTYPLLVPAFAAALHQLKPDMAVVLAGLPAAPEQVEAFKKAGIDEFIHVRADVLALLTQFLAKIGALK